MLDYWICRKQLNFSSKAILAFDEFLAEACTSETDVPYNLPYPKHMFLSYVTDCKQLLIHGSPVLDIDILKPVRHSRDVNTTGHEDKLLAASDGLRAMWFAILDKSRMGGITCNESRMATDESGNPYVLYFFSVGKSVVYNFPYNKGMMYVLPREPFTSQSGIEWATSESVKPLVRLPIDPKDFPYLDCVKGVEPEPMIQRVQSGIEGYPWIDDPGIFPIAPEIPLDKRASQFGIVKLGNLD
jgi:hypothetical protein